jgi:hypothetical protein
VEKPKKQFLEHDPPLFPSGFTQKQVFGKIILGNLKILSRSVCHDAYRSGEAEKTVFGT